LLQILQGFLCCDLFGAGFAQPWHILKELVLVPQKVRLVLPSHLQCSLRTRFTFLRVCLSLSPGQPARAAPDPGCVRPVSHVEISTEVPLRPSPSRCLKPLI
jgi:hypothetical protein